MTIPLPKLNSQQLLAFTQQTPTHFVTELNDKAQRITEKLNLLKSSIQPPAIQPVNQLRQQLETLFERLHDYVLSCYLSYEAPKKGTWQSLHILFVLAQKTPSILTGSGWLKKKPSIIPAFYARTLLLAQSNPFHLQQGDIALIEAYLKQNAGLIELAISTGETILPISFEQDAPFINQSSHQPGTNAHTAIVLDGLVSHLIKHTDSDEHVLGPLLSRQLLKSLTLHGYRAFQRVASEQKLILSLGVGSKCKSSKTHIGTLECAVVNQTPSGYCLQTKQYTPQIKNGQIAYIHLNEPNSYGIGVIRWHKVSEHGEQVFGLELKSARCTTTQISLPDSDEPITVIILPKQKSNNQPVSLISEKPLPLGQSPLSLKLDNTETTALLDELIEKTPHFVQQSLKIKPQ